MTLTPLTAGIEVANSLVTETLSELSPLQLDRPPAALERKYANEASRFVEVGDARIHYRDQGPEDAPTLLALHGSYSSLHTWDGWVRELRDDVRIVRLDMPGFGLTGPRQDGEHSLGYLGEAVAAFCEELGLSDVAIAGNSLGGAVAWRLATDRPDLCSRLVLVDAGGATMLTTLARNYTLLGTNVLPRFFAPRMMGRILLRDAYGDPGKVDTDLVTRYHDLVLRRGNRQAIIELTRNYQSDYVDDCVPITAADMRTPTLPSATNSSPEVLDDHDISDVEVPTLFQWGAEDRWLPVSFGRRLADQVDDHRFLTYPGVGHVPMEEAPEPTARDVAEFLRETDPDADGTPTGPGSDPVADDAGSGTDGADADGDGTDGTAPGQDGTDEAGAEPEAGADEAPGGEDPAADGGDDDPEGGPERVAPTPPG